MLGVLKNDDLLEAHAQSQAYIVLGNMMLAAAEIGIDSSPMEGFYPEKFDKILAEAGVLDPTTDRSTVMVAFGYRQSNTATVKTRPSERLKKLAFDYDGDHKTRRSLDEIVKTV